MRSSSSPCTQGSQYVCAWPQDQGPGAGRTGFQRPVWAGQSGPAWRSGPPGVGAGPAEAQAPGAGAPARLCSDSFCSPSWDARPVPACPPRVPGVRSPRQVQSSPGFVLGVPAGQGNVPGQGKSARERAGQAQLAGTPCSARDASLGLEPLRPDGETEARRGRTWCRCPRGAGMEVKVGGQAHRRCHTWTLTHRHTHTHTSLHSNLDRNAQAQHPSLGPHTCLVTCWGPWDPFLQ